MAKISGVGVGESLVGDGNEVAHIDLLIGPRGSAVETAFCNALTNNKDGFTTLKRGEAVLVIGQSIAKSGLHGAAARTDEQVDMSNFIAVTDERFTYTNTTNLGHLTKPSLVR